MSDLDVGSWVDERFPKGSDSVKNWMGRLSERTAIDKAYTLLRWHVWLKKSSPKWAEVSFDEMIRIQSEATNSERFDLLDQVQRFITETPGRHNSKKTYYTSLRSFFMHNRASLPEDPSFTIRSDVAPVMGKLNIDIFKRAVLSSNKCYQAIFTCMFQGGMGIGELLHWNETGYADLIEQLREDPKVVKINIAGRKHGKNIDPFYTFIGRDAIQLVRNWLEVRPEGASTIFVNQIEEPIKDESLRTYWTRKLKRLGFITQNGSSTGNRYGMNPHELRDLFRSRWMISGVDTKIAEWIMGHSEALDKFGYDKSPWLSPEWFAEQYHEAQPWLNVFSEDPQKIPKKELDAQRRRISELEAENRVLTERMERKEVDFAKMLEEENEYRKNNEERLDKIIETLKKRGLL